MDIKIPLSLLNNHLETNAPTEELIKALSLCGPTVDRVNKHKDDIVLEIEAITNRVDSASVLGIAREAQAILPEFGFEAKVINEPAFDKDLFISDKLPLEVQIMDQSLIPRFCAVVMENVTIKPSGKQTIDWLNSADVRDINNVVDITNELTLRYGQPCHVFDYDKIVGHKMIVRESKKGEKITTLDDKEHQLAGKDIVIEDGGGHLIDLCGVMGGQISQVDENTKRVILFVQIYEPRHIRRTSLATQERTLAAQIFEKNPDINAVDKVLSQGVKMLIDRAGGQVASELIDIYPNKLEQKIIKVDTDEVLSIAGTELEFEHLTRILQRLGFGIKNNENPLQIQVPSYRHHDINIKEDIVEEILRVVGYFRLPSVLPSTQLTDNRPDKLLNDEIRTKRLLADIGFNEVFNYSLTSKKLYTKANIGLNEYIILSNPLSEDFEIMRTSLIPQLLQVASDNVGKAKAFNFFELSNVYVDYKEGSLPNEKSTLGIISDNDFFVIKGTLELLAKKLGWDIQVKEVAPNDCFAQCLQISAQDVPCGRLGLINHNTIKAFGIDRKQLTVLELDFGYLSSHTVNKKIYRPIPSLTPLYLDVTLDTKNKVGDLLSKMKTFDSAIYDVEYISSFGDKKSFRIHFYDNGPVEQKIAEQILSRMTTELV
jgi:phenylalanyl-tRNA synthetase beta chain